MSDLDVTIRRLRALPKVEQEAIAAQIDLILDQPDDLLSPEQWAEVEARLDSGEGFTAHDDVKRDFRSRSK